MYMYMRIHAASLPQGILIPIDAYVSIYTYAHSCIGLASSLSTQQMCRPSQTPYLIMSSPQISPQTGHPYFKKS